MSPPWPHAGLLAPPFNAGAVERPSTCWRKAAPCSGQRTGRSGGPQWGARGSIGIIESPPGGCAQGIPSCCLGYLEWNNITRPAALAARAASRFPAQVAAQRPSAVTKGAALAPPTSRAASASVTSATCKAESRRNLKPTKPAVQISDAVRKRKILTTDKCTMALKKWREKGESFKFRVDRYRCIEGRCLHLDS